MVELFFGFLQLSFYIIVFTFIPITLFVRILSVFPSKNDLKHKILIIIDIFSLSYYYFISKENKYRKLYNTCFYIFSLKHLCLWLCYSHVHIVKTISN